MNRLFFFLLLFTSFVLGILPCKADDVPLRSGDQLTLRLGGVPIEDINQVSGIYTIDGAGNINMPYIGKVHAAGLKQADIQSSIETAYKNGGIYSAPIVTITVQLDRFVDVDGDVKIPQRVRYTPNMTLLSAVAACGGFDEFADPTKVTILRNGTRSVINVNKVKKNQVADPGLQPEDKINVPRSWM